MAEYINADEFRNELYYSDDAINMGGEYQGLWVRWRAIETAIDNHIADVTSVIHSSWEHIKVNGQYKIKCKSCGYIEPEYRSYIRDFCPNCGAKMDKEEEKRWIS